MCGSSTNLLDYGVDVTHITLRVITLRVWVAAALAEVCALRGQSVLVSCQLEIRGSNVKFYGCQPVEIHTAPTSTPK